MKFSVEKVKEVLKQKGYKFFQNGDYNLNIIGVRNLDPGRKVTNVFDDYLILIYNVDGVQKAHVFMITTDPGTKAVKNFSNPNGVARLIPNQYLGCFEIRKHQGKYDALCQKKPVRVWRDKNKDMTFDEVIVEEGIFGINIHRSNPVTESQYVENWSEGCQVFKKVKDFDLFMDICEKAKNIWGNSFTYTLLTTKNFE